jgi:hypothetical protein
MVIFKDFQFVFRSGQNLLGFNAESRLESLSSQGAYYTKFESCDIIGVTHFNNINLPVKYYPAYFVHHRRC